MFVVPFSVTSIVSGVWGATTRTLSADFYPVNTFGATNTLASATILDLRPTGIRFRTLNWINSGYYATLGVYDGTTFSGTSDAFINGGYPMYGGSGLGPAVQNNSAGSLTYYYSGFDRG